VCGIAGIMTQTGDRPDRAIVEAMGALLVHRGPDGQGSHFSADVGLVHRRLAIIDLETGAQPLADTGGVTLIANAEIYNHVELRASLEQATFSTGSDCEPILPLFRRQTRDFVHKLRGMYAFALHDSHTGELVLSRDPFGIKPLYYCESAQGFAFASEPQALLGAGLVTAEEIPERRNELLQLQFTTGPETIYKGIFRALPGETLVVRQGRIIERHRRDALPPGGPSLFEEERTLHLLDSVLADTVTVHQRADVPYGMFLSGGIDSAVLLSLMAELNAQPVVAYTVGFEGAPIDERDHAAALAHSVGAQHVPIQVTANDFMNRLPAVVRAMDDPAADYACLPTFLLAERAAEDVKVVLTGEGGDELFGGYGRYRSAIRPFWKGGRTMRRRGAFSGLSVLLSEGAGWRDGLVASASVAAQKGRSRLQAVQALDCADWLPNDLLIKVDRCLMANGLEGRTPFLDPLVAETVFRIDDRLKVRRGFGKYILRRWLEKRMPGARAFSKKRGFTVPVGQWIGDESARLAPMVAANPGIRDACRPGAVEALFGSGGKRQNLAMWILVFYALWHQIHIGKVDATGSILEVLDAR